VNCTQGELKLALPLNAEASQIRDAVQAWLMREARVLFELRLNFFAPQMGVQWRKLSLSNAGSRWGSARIDGAIRLNWRLIHLKPEAIDYVVVHELAHLRGEPPGPAFGRWWPRSCPTMWSGAKRCKKRIWPTGPKLKPARLAQCLKPPNPLRIFQSETFFRQTTVRPNVPPTRQGQTWFGGSPEGRLKITLSMSCALPACSRQASKTSFNRSSWCFNNCAVRVCKPTKGEPWDGNTKVLAGSGSEMMQRLHEQGQGIGLRRYGRTH